MDFLSRFLPRRQGNDPPPELPQPNNGPALQSSSDIHFPRSPSDVFHVTFILRQVLIPDLVPIILEHAEYWVRIVGGETNERRAVTERTAGRLYLAARIPEPRSIRQVIFTVSSRDQGWSDFRDSHGTYNNSWTWLEVVIFEPDAYELARVVGNGRRIVTNVHAGRDYARHTVIWDRRDHELGEMFIEMTAGRHIGVTAWARFPGWENRLAYARIEFMVAAVH